MYMGNGENQMSDKKNKKTTTERKRKTPAELEAKHRENIEKTVDKLDTVMSKLTKLLTSKRHTITPEEKVYALSYISSIYEKFGNEMTQERTPVEDKKFKLAP